MAKDSGFGLSTKEKAQKELETFKGLGGKAKLIHIWMYYKIQIAIAILVVLLIVFLANTVLDNRYQDILYVGVCNDYTVDDKAMEEYLRDYLGAESKFDTVTVDNALTLTAEEAEKNTGNVRLLAYAAISEIDVLICEEWVYDKLKGEYLNDDGIKVSRDNKILSQFGIDESDEWIVCTVVGHHHEANARLFKELFIVD